MDMLEKTATHEDLEQAMDQQYEDLLERSKVEALELVEENILKIEEKVKKAAPGGSAAQSTSSRATASARHDADGTPATEKQLAALRGQLLANIEAVAARIEAGGGAAGASVSEAVGTHDASLKKLGTTLQALDAKIDNTTQLLAQKVEITAEEMDRQLANTFASMEAKLDRREQTTNDRIESNAKTTAADLRAVKQTTVAELKKSMKWLKAASKAAPTETKDEL